jgi:mannose-6-phosphate isomerase
VHPPSDAAEELGGEPKSEFWYIAEAGPAAELYVGLTSDSSRERFTEAIEKGNVDEHVHRVGVKAGDCMFLPSGRVHAIGAGNVIVEVQQNSDTTYRVFDWNRKERDLHVEESLRSIDFNDVQPSLTPVEGESLVSHEVFQVEKWSVDAPRDAADAGRFAILCCVSGAVSCGGIDLTPGNFLLLPASLGRTLVRATREGSEILRVTSGAPR